MAVALDEFKVIDLTTMTAGPFSTMLLGDQGADVIKIEIHDRGNHVRTTANKQGGFSASIRSPAPCLSENTDEIANLRSAGIAGEAP